MKTNIIITLFLAAFTFSCGDKVTDKPEEAEVVSEIVNKEEKEPVSEEKIKDCEDFLDTYEKWNDDLIALMEEYKDDPVALATSPDYVNTMIKGVDFMQDWEKISVSCAMNPNYEARVKAVQEKMERKKKELGY